MNIEAAKKWIETEKFNQWRLEDSKSEKVTAYIDKDESYDEGLNRLDEILPILQPGAYTLKGYNGYSRGASANSFQFSVSVQKNTTSQQSNKMDQSQLEQLYKNARAEALEMFQAEQFRKDMEKRISLIENRFTAVESDLKKLSEIIQDLTDSDDENDDDALTRLTEIGSKMPEFAEGFNSIKSLWDK